MMLTGRKLSFLMMLLAAFAFYGSLTGLASAADLMQQGASPSDYAFTIQKGMLKMTDGVRLAVTYYKPTAKTAGETFPVVLEMLPYRKDDIFYLGDYQYGSYFAKRGYVIARVDVRGTGGSKGTLPDREYSDAELSDAVEVISQLSQMEWSNGNVGMYGISWSGFNSLMVAHRKPPALKAIIAAHASEDLFYNDVHYIDGVLHMDYYAQQIDTDNALPRSPGYRVDETWYKERFDREPWLFTWFREQQDGPFWRRESLRFKSPIEVPAYLIGGLLDGYRDFVTQVFQHSTAPVIAEIGPWNHAYPEYGKPGPNYEWRRRALRWWDYWLKGLNTGILNEPRFMVFVRDGYEPSTLMEEVPGDWRCEQTWPIEGSTWKRLYPTAGHLLGRTPSAQETSDPLVYRAGIGMAAGGWWGDQTPDMSGDDSQSLVYDSEELTETVEIIGTPQVSLRVAADAPLLSVDRPSGRCKPDWKGHSREWGACQPVPTLLSVRPSSAYSRRADYPDHGNPFHYLAFQTRSPHPSSRGQRPVPDGVADPDTGNDNALSRYGDLDRVTGSGRINCPALCSARAGKGR